MTYNDLKHKKIIYLTCLFVFVLFNVLSFSLYFITHEKTSKTSFTSSAESKAKHMSLNFGEKIRPDIIFIGNSRVMYHIDTGYLSAHDHFKSYNYGMEGHTLANFPYMIEQAVKLHPKVIVLGIDIATLYTQPQPIMDLYLPDIYAYIYTKQNLKYIFAACGNYFAKFNLIRSQSDIVHRFIVKKSKAFSGKLANYDVVTYHHKTIADEAYCKPFIYERNIGSQIDIVKCQNGDGILLGNTKLTPPHNQMLSKLNNNSIALLAYSLNLIKKNNIRAIIMFSPYYATRYDYDANAIRQQLHVPILDLTHQYIPRDYWANENHLNDAGRRLFTRLLATYLKKYSTSTSQNQMHLQNS